MIKNSGVCRKKVEEFVRNHRKQNRMASRAATIAILGSAAAAAVPFAYADVTANSSGSPTQNGIGNPAVTVSVSGSTALRNFLTSPGITFLNPGDSITLNNGAAGAPVTYTAPGVTNQSFQLASGNFTQADSLTGLTQVHSALRFEYHEQGATEGVLDVVNDQVGYVGGATGTSFIDLAQRNPSVANPIWVNRNKFTAVGTINGLSLANSTNNPYTAYGADGKSLTGGQNRVQIGISDMNGAQAFAVGGGTATGNFNVTPTNQGYGKGNNSHGLVVTSILPTNGAAIAHSAYQLVDQTVLNMSTDKVDPLTGANYTAGAWNTGGAANIQNTQIAITATTFSANPGTGLDKINKGDAQWLQTTGRFSNGAGFNVTVRDVGSGTRNVGANNTGVDPSFAVGVNDSGNGRDLTAGNTSQEQLNIGAAMRFSNKTSGGNQLRPTVQNNRMALGTLGLSDAITSVSGGGGSKPLRALSYSDSLDGSSPYVTISASSITDGTYVIWQNQTFVTVKAPNAAYSSTAAWAGATDAQTGIKGDNSGSNVAGFRNNIQVSTFGFPNSNSVANAADQLLATSFILPQMMQVNKQFDGAATFNNANYNDGLRNALLSSSYAAKFNVDAPGTITKGAGATYGNAGNNLGSFVGAAIKITDQNYLFGNFNQNGTRDFAALQTAVLAAKALETSGVGANAFSGSSNATVVTTGVAALDTMTNQVGGIGATKGDLIVMGDFAGAGALNGQSLYLFAKNAAVSNSTGTASLTFSGTSTLGDALRSGVSRKNDALDFLQNSTNVTSAMRIAASADLTNDPTGVNAFNKFDINRDGRISRNDAAIVDKFIGQDKTNLNHQLAATIASNGSVNLAGPQQTVNLYDVGLIDGTSTITTGTYTGTGTSVAVVNNGDFALVRKELGAHLKAGDTKFSGSVTFADISQIISRGKYAATASSSTRWSDGDFNGDNKVDFSDINAIITAGTFGTGNYDGGAPSVAHAAVASVHTPKLTSANPAVTTTGTAGDGIPDFSYDALTGDVKFFRDGYDVAKNVRSVVLLSAGNKFITGVGYTSLGNDSFDVDQTDQQAVGRFNGKGITANPLDLGNILPLGLTTSQLQSDLSLYFNYDGSGAADPNGVPVGLIVPEPTTLSLLGLGAVGLLARRRRKAK